MRISLVLMATGQVLKRLTLPLSPRRLQKMSHILSLFFLWVIIFWWLRVIIYRRAPLSSTEPAPSASFHQDYSQLHKHFTDKDGQLFTDRGKSYWQLPECGRGYFLVLEKVCEGGERMTKRACNIWPLLVWTPGGLFARTHLSNALSAAPTLYYLSEQCRIRRGPSLHNQSYLHLLVLPVLLPQSLCAITLLLFIFHLHCYQHITEDGSAHALSRCCR